MLQKQKNLGIQLQNLTSLQGAQPHTHPAHSRWPITSTVWAAMDKGPALHMSLSSKHIVPCVLKHVSGTYFRPSTEHGSGKGHKHKRGSSACTWKKAKPAPSLSLLPDLCILSSPTLILRQHLESLSFGLCTLSRTPHAVPLWIFPNPDSFWLAHSSL